MRLNLGNEQFLYFSTFADYTLTQGQFSLNGFFAMKINVEKDRFVNDGFIVLSNESFSSSMKSMNSMILFHAKA